MKTFKSRFLKGRKINASRIPANSPVVQLVDNYFQAYNAGRLREACQLFTNIMLKRDVTIGMSLTGALTPTGSGGSCVVLLMENGFVDWIVTTGANLYHDIHFSIGHSLHQGSPFVDDRQMRKEGVIRIYDILFDYRVLLSTDDFFRTVIRNPEFQNETAALVLDAKRKGGKSGVVIWGGGSPKNFMLQTEPQIQEVLKIKEKGHDYFLQVTDARPDTGGLSGATPSEAVSWGKVDPDKLPDTVVVYLDTTVAMPILTSYALAKHRPRRVKRLYDRREESLEYLRTEYQRSRKPRRKQITSIVKENTHEPFAGIAGSTHNVRKGLREIL